MFIGHIPAGYLATTPLLGRSTPRERRRLLLLGMAASVIPDLDLFYFYFVDERRHVHHSYLPHLPLAWLAALGMAAMVLGLLRARRTAWLALAVLGLNVLLHLVLDSVAGGIWWLWPFSDVELALATVRAVRPLGPQLRTALDFCAGARAGGRGAVAVPARTLRLSGIVGHAACGNVMYRRSASGVSSSSHTTNTRIPASEACMSAAPDFVVRAPNDGIVLAVEAKNRPDASPEWAAQMRRDLAVHGFLPDAPFFLLALRDHFFLWKQPSLLQLVPPDYQAATREVLRPYLEYLRTPLHELSEIGFESVVGLWLEDLVHGTANGASEWLQASGLRECLRNAVVTTPAGV